MTGHRYTLEPYKGMKTRHTCPACQHRDKTFSRYIDTTTGEQIHPGVGRCNRLEKCGYHYKPGQYFQENPHLFKMGSGVHYDSGKPRPQVQRARPVMPERKQPSFIPVEVFKASLNLEAYKGNHFVKFLSGLFGPAVAGELVSRYFIATSRHWEGSTVFWQIDRQGKVRTGKIMLYSPDTGKRIKEPFNHIHWAHRALKRPDFELRQCLFGEHLLKEEGRPVALVESEKTAIIASAYLPGFIWLATGGISNLSAEKCEALAGRTVFMFPDLKAFDSWSNKAKELSHLATFIVSDLLERNATAAERDKGLDLADYLTKFSLSEFEATQGSDTGTGSDTAVDDYPEPEATTGGQAGGENFKMGSGEHFDFEMQRAENWKLEISELESYFAGAGAALPAGPVRLNQCSAVTNVRLFVESHFATVKANNGNRAFLPYLNRLQELRQILVSN